MKNTKTISISLTNNEIKMLNDLIKWRTKAIRNISRSDVIAELIDSTWNAEKEIEED